MKDAKNGVSGKKYSATDPQVQLRMLTENIPHQVKPGWYPFDGQLVAGAAVLRQRAARRPQRLGARRLVQRRRRLPGAGHRRAAAVRRSAPSDAADEVATIRLNLRRVTADKDDRRTLKSAATTPDSAGLKPWREVLQPHDDVATGNFQAREFAADLYKVAPAGEAGKDYADPVEFFAPHLPHRRAARPDRAGGAAAVGRRQRLAGDQPADQLRRRQDPLDARAVAPGCRDTAGRLPAGGPGAARRRGYDELHRRPPGRAGRQPLLADRARPSRTAPQVNTLWGELAWQLGGAEGYAIVADADRTGTNPGKALHDLLGDVLRRR